MQTNIIHQLREKLLATGGSIILPKGVTVDADFLGVSEPFTVHRVFIEPGTVARYGSVCLGMAGGIPVLAEDISDEQIQSIIDLLSQS